MKIIFIDEDLIIDNIHIIKYLFIITQYIFIIYVYILILFYILIVLIMLIISDIYY